MLTRACGTCVFEDGKLPELISTVAFSGKVTLQDGCHTELTVVCQKAQYLLVITDQPGFKPQEAHTCPGQSLAVLLQT